MPGGDHEKKKEGEGGRGGERRMPYSLSLFSSSYMVNCFGRWMEAKKKKKEKKKKSGEKRRKRTPSSFFFPQLSHLLGWDREKGGKRGRVSHLRRKNQKEKGGKFCSLLFPPFSISFDHALAVRTDEKITAITYLEETFFTFFLHPIRDEERR